LAAKETTQSFPLVVFVKSAASSPLSTHVYVPLVSVSVTVYVWNVVAAASAWLYVAATVTVGI
jgi:hypothetical protein